MVDKCPNCGQPSRPGARFCTSCGFRLPERPVEQEPSPLSRSPFATTSTVAASWWPSATATDEKTEPAGEQEQDAGTVEESAPAATAESSVADEPVAADADALVSETVATAEEPAAEPAAQEPATFADWPSFPSYSSTSSEPASAWPPSSSETADSTAREPEDLAAAVEEMAGGGESEPSTEPETESDAAPTVATEPETPTWSAPPDDDDHDAPPAFVAPAPSSPPASVDTETLSRARSLLDELGALLPALAAPAPTAAPAASADFSAVAAGLVAARNEAGGQQSQFDALMAVVETARARPRDIDVMLDLSRHVEAIVSLKAGYDRYGEAVDAALAQLQPE